MATITQAQTVGIVELYIAFFGRAPEHSGLEFWKAELSASIDAGVAADAAMNTIADRFYDAALQYSEQTGYDQDTTITQFVEETYSNVLLRTGAMAPDASEIAYWVGRYGDGLSRGEVVREMISDAKAFAGDPEFGGIVATLSNRTTVGLEFAEQDNSGDLSGVEAYAAGKAALAGVDATDASVDAAISAFAGPPEGTVIDGKVAGATVGIDVNGDGVISDDEPTVTTDAQGNYQFPDGTPRGTVIASGGTDLSTGLAFEGELTAPSGSDVVSPLTTLIDRIAQGDTDPNKTQAEKVADAQTQLKALLGLSDVDADLTKFDVVTETSENDPSGADGLSDGNALRLYAASVKLMNVIEQGAAAIEGAGNVDGKTAFKAMVDSLSGELRGGSGPVDLNSGDSQTIVNAINGAASQTLDADGQAKVAGIAESAAKIAAAGNTEVDNAVNALGAGDPVNPNDPDSGSSINDALVSIVKSQKAVQGDGADQIRQGAQNGEDGADAANDFSDGNGGINDDVQNNQNVGDVNGDGQDDDGQEGAENDGGGTTGGGGGTITPPSYDVDEGESLQDAIDNAADGATITVGPGTFTGRYVLDSNVTIEGAAGTVIEGGFHITAGAETVGLENIDISTTGSSDVDAAIYADGGDLDSLSLTDVDVDGTSGANGLTMGSTSSGPGEVDVDITGGSFSNANAGIYAGVNRGNDIDINGTEFSGNNAAIGGVGTDTGLTVLNSTFSGNTTEDIGVEGNQALGHFEIGGNTGIETINVYQANGPFDFDATNVDEDNVILVAEGGSLQAAIDAADEGDTVLISGKHTGRFTVDESVTVVGTSDAEIVGGFHITTGAETVGFENIDISTMGSNDVDAAIYADGGDLTSLSLTDVDVDGTSGANGLTMGSTSSGPSEVDVDITGGSFSNANAGIYAGVSRGNDIDIDGTEFSGNTAAIGGVGADTDLTVLNSTFSGNITEDIGVEGNQALGHFEIGGNTGLETINVYQANGPHDFDANNVNEDNVILVAEGGSIQDAVDAAQDGDTIFVADGTYNQDVSINKSGISIVGESEDGVVINGQVSIAGNTNAGDVNGAGLADISISTMTIDPGSDQVGIITLTNNTPSGVYDTANLNVSQVTIDDQGNQGKAQIGLFDLSGGTFSDVTINAEGSTTKGALEMLGVAGLTFEDLEINLTNDDSTHLGVNLLDSDLSNFSDYADNGTISWTNSDLGYAQFEEEEVVEIVGTGSYDSDGADLVY